MVMSLKREAARENSRRYIILCVASRWIGNPTTFKCSKIDLILFSFFHLSRLGHEYFSFFTVRLSCRTVGGREILHMAPLLLLVSRVYSLSVYAHLLKTKRLREKERERERERENNTGVWLYVCLSVVLIFCGVLWAQTWTPCEKAQLLSLHQLVSHVYFIKSLPRRCVHRKLIKGKYYGISSKWLVMNCIFGGSQFEIITIS